jgi:hypothetical protein
MIGSKQSNKEERSSTNLCGDPQGFAQKNQTSPQITLMTLIYTDQKSSTGTFEFVKMRVIRVPSSEICFFGKSRTTARSAKMQWFSIKLCKILRCSKGMLTLVRLEIHLSVRN